MPSDSKPPQKRPQRQESDARKLQKQLLSEYRMLAAEYRVRARGVHDTLMHSVANGREQLARSHEILRRIQTLLPDR